MIVGVDEAGRGPLAGPVFAAAVLLGNAQIEGLDDSKKLSPAKREQLSKVVIEECLTYGIACATVEEIDQLNILQATMIAMQRAVAGIVIVPNEVLIDGNCAPDLPYPTTTVVGGDTQVPEIMAASILAKASRDRHMVELDREFPVYGFAQHKGYPTAQHLEALRTHGACVHHRRTFSGVPEDGQKQEGS